MNNGQQTVPVRCGWQAHPKFNLTRHVKQQMSRRGIGLEDLIKVLQFGRRVHVDGSVKVVVGRKEVCRARTHGLCLRAQEGIHVVMGAGDAVMTVYRNHNLRALKPRRHRRRRCAS